MSDKCSEMANGDISDNGRKTAFSETRPNPVRYGVASFREPLNAHWLSEHRDYFRVARDPFQVLDRGFPQGTINRHPMPLAPGTRLGPYEILAPITLVRVVASVLFVFVASTLLPAQTIVRSFDGDKGPETEHCNPQEVNCGRQAEMMAAANGKEVVQVTWQHVNVYDYKGKLLHSTMLPDLIRKAGLDPKRPYEPHIVFDEFIGRWIINVSCLNDCFIVSASADPSGPWHGVYMSCLQGGPCLSSDPSLQLGYDKNGVYHCAGHPGDDNPNTIKGVAYDCFAIPPEEVKGIGEGKNPVHLNRHHNMMMHIRPAVDQNPRKAASAPALFAARTCDRSVPGGCQNAKNFPFEWLVTTFSWNGPTGTYGEDQVIQTDIGSHRDKWLYNIPCCGPKSEVPQAGTDIGVRMQESHRLNNLVQNGSHLQVVFSSGPCTHDCGAQGENKNNVMFWADLDCTNAAACKVAQTTKISGPDAFFPSIGVDNKGNVGIVAASSSQKDYLSILLWTHRATDPANTFSAPITMVAGTKPYTCPNRMNLALIASAVGMLTSRDPLDGSKLWTTHQYSADATPCVWNSKIIEYRPGAATKSAAKSKAKR